MPGFYQRLKQLQKLSAIATRLIVTGLAAVVTIAPAWSAPAPAGQAVIDLDPSIYAHGPRLKAENGMIIVWAPTSRVSPDRQIRAFDSRGRETLSLNLLESLPEAKNIVISDVSVSPDGMVAVGAQIFTGKDHGKPKLLLLDSAGHLVNSINFDEGLGVLKLAVDADQDVCVLRRGAGMADPAKIPVLAKYDRDGNLIGTFLHFSDFAKDGQIIHGGLSLGGDVSMGVTQERVWFWLPSSRELVILHGDGTDVQRVSTGLPPWPGVAPEGSIIRVRSCDLSDSDGLLCQVAFSRKAPDAVGARTLLYQFSGNWQPAQPATLTQHTGNFLSLDQENALLATFEPKAHSVSFDWVPVVR